ncbi:MAG: hypothetical protein HY924_04075 [Elusimicrobia bacterium]|nr:hypothetical protein [Elusimicrobiota bacterium]
MPTPIQRVSERIAFAARTAFDRLPPEMVVSAFGVQYGHLSTAEGGDLFVTRLGWPMLDRLLPSQWYADGWYASHGSQLKGSTGNVYRVASRPAGGKSLDLVVKFSRMAQEVPLEVSTGFPDNVPPEVIANARFNSPMEEFGLVMELRGGGAAPELPRMLTQKPLAIYVPPETYQLWELGRSRSRFENHGHMLSRDQEHATKAIELDIRRMYVLVYGWIKGLDAEDAAEDAGLDAADLERLTVEVIAEMHERGFRVLDNKPKHFIVRPLRRGGGLLHREGALVYGLVDYELLQRTTEHQEAFWSRRRQIYRDLFRRRDEPSPASSATHLRPGRVFGVDYLYAETPDGGRVWTVGRNPGLFDYFLASRWHRTPRTKLSPRNEVYATRTRDGIDIVYRKSNVGVRPRADPFERRGRQIREHGYNSPFETVAIAEALRRKGIAATVPLAITRTGHHSGTARFLHDARRFRVHEPFRTPGAPAEPILIPDFDYYTLWASFGCSGQEAGATVDLETARARELLDDAEFKALAGQSRADLVALGIAGVPIANHEFLLSTDAAGRLERDARGKTRVALAMDALTAFEYQVLKEDRYQDLLRRISGQLGTLGVQKLDFSGNDVLVLLGLDGEFLAGPDGEISGTLCSFELMRGFEGLIGEPPEGVPGI